MKLAILTSSYLPVVGGRQVFAHNISRQLSALGHEVHVYVPGRSYRALGPQHLALLKPLPRPFFGLLREAPFLGRPWTQWYLRRKQLREEYDVWLVLATYPSGHSAAGLRGLVLNGPIDSKWERGVDSNRRP